MITVSIKTRDNTRNKIKNSNNSEKIVLNEKYKSPRNKVTSQIRKENLEYNNNRIRESKSESELWKNTNDVINPEKKTTITQDHQGSCVIDHQRM